MGYRNPNSLPGTQTYVNEDNAKNIPPDEQFQGKGNSGGGQASPSTKPDQRTQALPRVRKPDSEIGRPAQPVVNSPPQSGGHPDGSIHKDRMRTKGVPGDQYKPEVIDQPRGQFRRRSLNAEEGHEAGTNMGKKPSGASKQRAQKGTAKKKSHLWYLKNRKQVIRRQMLRYRKNKKKGLFKRDKRLRRQHPNWFARKPGGGYSSAKQRAKDYRGGNTRTKTKHNTKSKGKKAFLQEYSFVVFYDMPVRMDGEGMCTLRGVNPNTGKVVYQYKDALRKISFHDFFLRVTFAYADDLLEFLETLDALILDDPMTKQAYSARRKSWGKNKKHRGTKFFKGKRYRMQNKGKIKTKQKVRRQRLKRNPKFKRMQKIRRRMQKQSPRRFRLRLAEVLTSPEIAFVAGKDMRLGFVRNLSTMTGWVTYKLGSGRVASMPLPAFWNSVVFLEESDLEAMFDLIDVEVGLGAYQLEMNADHMRMCMDMMQADGNSEDFRNLCMSETGVASIDAMTADQLESVASNLINSVLMGGGRQVDNVPEGDLFPRDEDDLIDGEEILPLYFGQVSFPEEDSVLQPNSAARVAARCADIGVYDKADLVRRESNPKEKSPTSLPDGEEEEAGHDGLPTWVGPNKLKEERENQTPAHGLSIDRDRPGAPGSARVIPRGQGFTGKTANREIVAVKMAEIIDGCSPKIHEKSTGLGVSRSRVDPRNAVWLFNVDSATEQGATYRVRLKAVRKGNLKTLAKADVLVSCNCKFWQWQGPEHWAKAGGYLYGKPMGTASKPSIKDPDKQHAACKHVVATLKYLSEKNIKFRSKQPSKRRTKNGGVVFMGRVPRGEQD